MKLSLITIVFLILNSCDKIDCETLAKKAKERECLLIIEKLPVFSKSTLDAEGKHLITKKDCKCSDGSRWWTQYRDYLEEGDTIIKRKGELIFSIHKKDTVLNFNWECEGKVYK